MNLDEKYMKKVLNLARKGMRKVSPNPMVGALIVKDGKIIAKGYHHGFGLPHAEIDCMQKVESRKRKIDLKGATMYVNLEPCCFYGKTPPCTDAIIASGISEVVIGMKDPNPRVSGKGVKILEDAGIKTKIGVLENEARELNKFFIKYITERLPYVTLKIAATVDGKIAKRRGVKSEITGVESRKIIHALRAMNDAVLTGAGTVKVDDPHLGVRYVKGKDPFRVILGKNLPKNAKVFRDKNVMVFDSDNINLRNVLEKLYKCGIASVLVEAGNKINTSFLNAELVDEIQFFIAPKYFGEKALKAFNKNFNFYLDSIKKIKKDMLLIFKKLSSGSGRRRNSPRDSKVYYN